MLQEAIELAPQQPLGLRNLAWIYATCPDPRFRNAAKAVELARRACELSEWNNAQYRQTLADAYLAAGDGIMPSRSFERSIQLSPTDPAAAKQLQSIRAAASVRNRQLGPVATRLRAASAYLETGCTCFARDAQTPPGPAW